MRLQVFLSRSRICSRRKALELVKEGRVKVNDTTISEPSYSVKETDSVYFDNKKVEIKKNDYLILNKPPGYVTTLSDRHAKLKVIDLLPATYKHLYPVGRLDRESEGLLIFTNDGDLTFKLLHPSFKVDKVYSLCVRGSIKQNDLLHLQKGVVIEGRRTHPAKIDSVSIEGAKTRFNITIHEGRKRQIRLMLASLGYSVQCLRRIKYGPIELENLASGKCRILSDSEVLLLFKACGLS